MSSLKVILESHPIKNLNGIIKEIKEGLTLEKRNLLSLSKDKKRHSKATLIEHILKLDKMGLLKERPSMYEKPVRAKKVKVEVKAEPKKDKKKQLKEAIKKGQKIIESKKQEAGTKIAKKATAQEIKDSLMVPGKYTPDEIKSGKALVKNQKKQKKPRSEKQKANDKKLGEAAKARAAAKKK